MLRILSEYRDSKGLLVAAAGGWIALSLGHSGAPMHHEHPELAVSGVAMACVMLYPILIEPSRHVRRSSFRSARSRHLLLFLSAYILVWAAYGTAAAFAAASIPPELAAVALAIGLAFAWLWQRSPIKLAAAGQCHATWPVYGGGTAGAMSAARYGVRIGAACLLSCGPIMLAAMLAPWPSVAMLIALLLIAHERSGPPRVLHQNASLLGAATISAVIFAGL